MNEDFWKELVDRQGEILRQQEALIRHLYLLQPIWALARGTCGASAPAEEALFFGL